MTFRAYHINSKVWEGMGGHGRVWEGMGGYGLNSFAKLCNILYVIIAKKILLYTITFFLFVSPS